MKRLLIVLLYSISIINLSAQMVLEYNIQHGKYKMGDMRELLNTIGKQPDLQKINIRNVANFPAYVAHTANIGFKINQHEFGIKSSFYTTGGKLSVADYSGAINIIITTNGSREGLYYKYHFYEYTPQDSKKLSVWGEVSPAVILTILKTEKQAREGLLDDETLQDDRYDQCGYAILPQIGANYYVTEHLHLALSLGYELSFGGRYTDLQGSPRADWSGVRLNGGLGYTF